MAILRVNATVQGTHLLLTSDDGSRTVERIISTNVLQTAKRPERAVLTVLETMEAAIREAA